MLLGQETFERRTGSAEIRARVVAARDTARERFADMGWICNAQASGTWMREHLSRKALEPVSRALESQRLSLRGADRAMRLAWTLADLKGLTSPGHDEISQGIALRTHV